MSNRLSQEEALRYNRQVILPQIGEEGLYTALLDHARVREERQNFDPSGHYARPDVTRLVLNRKRQSVIEIEK